MKFRIFIALFLCVSWYSVMAQMGGFGLWEELYSDGSIRVEVAFKIIPCKVGEESNNKSQYKYRVTGSPKSTSNQYLNWKMDYIDCNGNLSYRSNAFNIGSSNIHFKSRVSDFTIYPDDEDFTCKSLDKAYYDVTLSSTQAKGGGILLKVLGSNANFFKKVKSLYDKKDYKGALEQVNLLIETLPNYAGTYYYRGYIYQKGFMNTEKAIDDYTKAIQLQPDFNYAYIQRAFSYNYLGKKNEAIKDITKAISIDKDDIIQYFLRGDIKITMNDLLGAISDYDEVIKYSDVKMQFDAYSIQAHAYCQKASCLVKLDKYNEALFSINEAMKLRRRWYFSYVRGEIYYKLGQYNEAIEDMNKAIEDMDETGSSLIDVGYHKNPFYIRGLARIKLGCKDLSKAGELGEAEAYEVMTQYCK